MKKIFSFVLVFALLLNSTYVSAETKLALEKPTYLKIQVDNDTDEVVLSWKNSKEVQELLKKGNSINYEIDLKNNGNPWHSEGNQRMIKGEIDLKSIENHNVILTKQDFTSIDELDIFSANYSFRVRYVLKNQIGSFSGIVTIGMRPNYERASLWAEEELNKANLLGFIPATIQKNMGQNITRKEFSEVVIRVYEKISGESINPSKWVFKDTNDTSINKAAKIGVIKGDAKANANPNNSISRQEMAIMIQRLFLSLKKNLPADVTAFNFKDSVEIEPWAKDAIKNISAMGIIGGDSDNYIYPKKTTTREEAVVMIYRAYLLLI